MVPRGCGPPPSVRVHYTEPHSFRRNCSHPLLLVLLVEVQQHAQHWDELLLVLLVSLLEELQQHVLEVDIVNRIRRL